MQKKTWAQYLGWKYPLEKGMATHSSTLAWKLPWTEEAGGLQSVGSQESDMTQQLNCYYCWIMEKAREFQKNIYFFFIDYAKGFDCVDHNQLWKILKEMGIPDHLTCLLRNLQAGQEAKQLELDMEQQTGSKQEKEYVKAVYCHPAYLTYMQSTS